jgi:hypothetical protein
VTYNFDAERWYENRRKLLDARHERGELDDNAYAEACDALEHRYEEIVARLDGSFRLPT